jgi:hypothetical protein
MAMSQKLEALVVVAIALIAIHPAGWWIALEAVVAAMSDNK